MRIPQPPGIRNCAQESDSAAGRGSATMVLMSGKPDLDKIRRHIEANLDRQLPLAELGRLVHLSPFTVQRLFKEQMGASPLQYQRALRAGSLRKALKQGESVTDAIYNAGFG